MESGTIEYINPAGNGTIRVDETGGLVPFGMLNCLNDLQQLNWGRHLVGRRVTFSIQDCGSWGKLAAGVTVLEAAGV